MADTPTQLIPNNIATEIFEAHTEVVQFATAHASAKLVLKAAREDLEEAQTRLADLISEAKSGQTKMFNGQ